MPSQVTEFDVFVSGPDDVLDEKDAVEDVIQELNRLFRDDHDARLNVLVWPDDFVPGVGDHPQDVINEQIRGEFDIYLGILWKRFGAETDEAGSGTKEEFELALEEKEDQNDRISVQVYFKTDPPTSLDDVDPDQWKNVKEFQNDLSDTGVLYGTFDDTQDLRQQLRFNLKRVIARWQDDVTETENGEREEREISVKDRQEGFFDLVERGNKCGERLVEIGNQIAEATNDFGEIIDRRTEELSAVSEDDPQAATKAKGILNEAAANIRTYSGQVEELTGPLGDNFESMVGAWSRAATLWDEDFEGDVEEVEKARDTGRELLAVTRDTRDRIDEFRQVMDSMPRATKEIIHAKARGASVLRELHRRLNQGVGRIEDALEEFDRIIGEREAG